MSNIKKDLVKNAVDALLTNSNTQPNMTEEFSWSKSLPSAKKEAAVVSRSLKKLAKEYAVAMNAAEPGTSVASFIDSFQGSLSNLMNVVQRDSNTSEMGLMDFFGNLKA